MSAQNENLRGAPGRVFLLGATFQTRNMGVGALTAGALRCLRDGFPGSEILLLDYGREPSTYTVDTGGERVTVRLVNLRFSKNIFLGNNIAYLIVLVVVAHYFLWRSMRERLFSANPWLREIQQGTLFASIAGGDSFSDIYGLGRLFYVTLPQILVLLMRKPLVLLPQTLGPFRGGLARRVARFILNRADLILARDQHSLEQAKTWVSPKRLSKLRFCFDLGFLLRPVAPAKVAIEGLSTDASGVRPLVGVNVSGLLCMGGYSRANMFGLRADYVQVVGSLVRMFIREKGADVILVPHVFGGAEHAESDSVACTRMFEGMKSEFPGRLGLVQGTYHQGEIKHVIGGCEFFVGARMHACIAAVSQSIPAVSTAYSDKFIGVMEAVGIGSCVTDLRTATMEQALELAGRKFDERARIRTELQEKNRDIEKSVLDLFHWIAEHVPGQASS